MKTLLEFLNQSPSPYHVVANAKQRLKKAGFEELKEDQNWHQLSSGKYYVTRNESSIIAFNYNGNADRGFRMVGAHTDSPCLKLKPNALLKKHGYIQLALEVYGGALLNPWFDRDLGVAGRITVEMENGTWQSIVVDSQRAVAVIPSLAIHLEPSVNQGREINKQWHLPAIIDVNQDDDFDFADWLKTFIPSKIKDAVKQILSHELSLYDTQKATLIGNRQNLLMSARLDNLLSCYAALEAVCESESQHNTLIVLNDHEEVGSDSASGANGPFLYHCLRRLSKDEDSLQQLLHRSFLISADNAHAIHPNYADKHEPNHAPVINQGLVIKINNNQRYATNSETEAMFKLICQKAGVKTQTMVVRSDMGCGSTIGPLTATKLGIKVIDIGVPQMAMHSIREVAGIEDQQALIRVLNYFFDMETV